MAIRFKEALVFPFLPENRVDALVFPGVIALLSSIVYLILNGVVSLVLAQSHGMPFNLPSLQGDLRSHLTDMLTSLLNTPFSFLVSVVIMGFQWHFFAACHEATLTHQPVQLPRWREQGWHFLVDGLKLWLFFLITGVVFTVLTALVFIPSGVLIWMCQSSLFQSDWGGLLVPVTVAVFLTTTAVVLLAAISLSPFLWSPYVHSCRVRTFKSLWNIKQLVSVTIIHYWPVCWAMCWMALVGLIYFMASLMLCLTCVGGVLLPVLWGGGYLVTCWHLAAQGFGMLSADANPSP